MTGSAPKLPPFVILKRALAVFCGLMSLSLIGMALFCPAEAKAPSEGEQIAIWSFSIGLGVVGLWLWGGRDPDARN